MELHRDKQKAIQQDRQESQGLIDVSKHNPCQQARDPCNKNLKQCIDDETRYPYYQIDIDIHKFDKIANCDDRGWIDGKQCTKIICSEKAGLDDNNKAIQFDQAIPGIVECEDGNKAHSI